MNEKKLGKISNVKFGIGGYNDAEIGIFITLSGESWGVQDCKSAWDAERIKCSKHSKWSEENRSKQYDDIMRTQQNKCCRCQ